MQRTNIMQLLPSRKQAKILRECMLLSSCVYNMANYEVRQCIFKNEKVPNLIALQQHIQNKEDYKHLGRSYGLPRLHVYSETNSARFKLIKSKTQVHVGLPKYLKNRKTNTTIPSYLVMDAAQYSVNGKTATLPLSRQMRKQYGITHFKIKYNGLLRWHGKQQRGQIHEKDGKFYLYQSVEVSDAPASKGKNSAGIDLGIKRLFAITCSNGAQKLIGSRRHFKQWQYWTKLISDEQSRLAGINRKSSRRLQRLFSKRSKYQDNLYNNLTLKAFKFLRRNAVSQIYIGDVSGIREDADKGKLCNSMLHNYWAYDQIYHKCDNKAGEYGIRIQRDDESYSSQTCPCCGIADKSNKKDRLFLCGFCGYFGDRDLVGSENILDNGMRDHNESAHQGETALSRGDCDAAEA